MRHLTTLLLCCVGIGINNAQAQFFCGTDELYQQQKSENPSIAQFEAKLEEEIKRGMQQLDWSSLAKTTNGDTVHYNVPIVVHIIHDYGLEYVTDNAIFEAVDNWSKVFLAQNPDTADVIAPFKPYVGNSRIRLRLATKDPAGNPTKGITRHHSYLTHNAGDQAKLGGWPNNSYINLWFINSFSSSHSGAAAYAYYPASGANLPYYDGIISVYSYLDYDKVIPHEIGHVLNLQHVWGNTNQPNVACGNDLVDDTPPTMGHLPTGCTAATLYDVTCATNYYVTLPDGTIIDYPDTTNAQNIMDYSYCYRMFTKGQVVRMRQSLTSSVAGRNNLFSPANLAATGALDPRPDIPPTAEFIVERPGGGNERGYFLCAGDHAQFVFRNRSWNDTITGVSWTFSNDPITATSTSLNTVNNQFSTPGWVTVSLTATGNNSGSNTLTDPQAVYAADPTSHHPAGFTQHFDSPSQFDTWPIFNYFKNTFKWEWYDGAGYNSSASVRYRSFDHRSSLARRTGSPVGDYDDIITHAFDLSSYPSGALNLNFMTAGSFTGNGNTPLDSLQLLVSTNCGRIWRRIAVISGTNLINRPKQSSEFIPTSAAHWKAQTISIPAMYRTEKAFFKLRYWPSRTGNNLYLDNFSISPFTTDVREVAANPETVSLFPNPAQGDVTMVFATGKDGKVQYTIRDITGKMIHTHTQQFAPGIVQQHNLPRRLFPAAGCYIVSVTITNNTVTKKLILE